MPCLALGNHQAVKWVTVMHGQILAAAAIFGFDIDPKYAGGFQCGWEEFIPIILDLKIESGATPLE